MAPPKNQTGKILRREPKSSRDLSDINLFHFYLLFVVCFVSLHAVKHVSSQICRFVGSVQIRCVTFSAGNFSLIPIYFPPQNLDVETSNE